jgi:hypothetical protein
MKHVRTAQIDPHTGEILEGAQLAVIFPKRKNGFTEGWIAMAQNPLVTLAQANIGQEAWRVFAIILGNLDYENWINLNQTELAKKLDMKQPNFARGLKSLIDEEVLLLGPKIGRNRTFRLNPQYGWKGSAKNHKEALQERMRERGLSLITGATPIERDTKTIDMFEHQ